MAVLDARVNGAWVPISGIAPPMSRLNVFANVTERTAAYPNPKPGDMCQLTDTGWIWWYRTNMWVPLQASITSTSYSWGGWSTTPALSAGSQTDIGAYFFDNQLYTTVSGAKFPGRYTLKIQFMTPGNSDSGYFSIMANMGGQYFVSSSQMTWAYASSTSVAVLNGTGYSILFQFYKNASQAAWGTSTVQFSLSYEAV